MTDVNVGQQNAGQQGTPPPQAGVQAEDQPGPQGQGTPPPQAGNQAEDQPGPVPYDRFREVNERAKAYEAQIQEIEQERKAAQEKQLAEENRWKELYEQRENELKAERLRNAKQQVAMQKGLPADLVDRLIGDTPEALAEDADRLLQFVKPKEGPGVPPSGRNSRPANVDLANMSPEQIRKFRRGD